MREFSTLQIKVIDETNKLMCRFWLYIIVYIIFTIHYIGFITAMIIINCFKIGFPSLACKMVLYGWFKMDGWMDGWEGGFHAFFVLVTYNLYIVSICSLILSLHFSHY